ncbi:MAG TPA: ABC transporter ATP-binding protein [Alphaproteobacteria bacterium]|nr:ABC transporter ATP-binding protein [Alphaproteobacteria bacterium]
MSVVAANEGSRQSSEDNRRAPRAGAQVRLDRLTKLFGPVKAVDDVSLDIPSGSFVTLLGPSGSGKTTTLNLIAGFLAPDSGEIRFDGRAVSAVPPHKRNIGMVFQSYALFPHMTVFDNVAYPLRMRDRLSRQAMQARVAETLALVQLSGFEERYPRQLSGGQQQRVSMARALVSRPRLLLMDEPLGALDKKLREQLQVEIKQIHRRIGSTFVYVTHDQSEALTMSDLVVVMHNSRISQVGSPREVYEAPNNAFVADFLGGANLLRGQIVAVRGDFLDVRIPSGQTIPVPRGAFTDGGGTDVSVFIRPEDIRIAAASGQRLSGLAGTPATIREVLYLGEALKVTALAGSQAVTIRALRSEIDHIAPGRDVFLSWAVERSRLLAPAEDR